MKHRSLLLGAYRLSWLSTLCLTLIPVTLLLAPAALVIGWLMSEHFSWLLLGSVLPIMAFWLAGYGLTQTSGAACAYLLHRCLGTHGAFAPDGVHLQESEDSPAAFFAWSEVKLVRRVYARYFPSHQARFRDELAYQITLAGGAAFFIDFLDQTALSLPEVARLVPTEGFDCQLLASAFEPLMDQGDGASHSPST